MPSRQSHMPSRVFTILFSFFLLTGFAYEDQTFAPGSEGWKVANPEFPPLAEIIANNKKHKVLVAVIDSGVDYNHPALVANMHYDLKGKTPALGYDFAGHDVYPSYRLFSKERGKRDLKTEIKETTSHGTHVAGIVTRGNAAIGVIPYRVLPFSIEGLRESQGKYTSTNEQIIEMLADTLMQSIKLAKFQGARVTNMSLGVNSSDDLPAPLLARAFKKLDRYMAKAASNMVHVIAAGNEGEDISTSKKIFPCQSHSANVICVGALSMGEDGSVSIAGFSNVGLQYVDIFAPGDDIVSTVPTDHVRPGRKPFKKMSGTSMASPYVAGVASHMLIKKPCLTSLQVGALLNKTAKKASVKIRLGNSTKENYLIRIVNPKAAITAAENATCR